MAKTGKVNAGKIQYTRKEINNRSTRMSYLKRVLEEKQMSQKDLARRTGISATTINRYCNKKYGKLGINCIRLETLIHLSIALDVPASEILEGVMNDD